MKPEPVSTPEPDARDGVRRLLLEHIRGVFDAIDTLITLDPQEKLLRFAEAAEILAVDKTHVGRLARAGHLKLVPLGKASPRVTLASVNDLIARGGVKGVRWTRRKRNTLLADALAGRA